MWFFYVNITCRSSRPYVFCKKDVYRNFTKFTGKHLCQSLFFNKVAGLRAANLLKKRLWHRCFPVNFFEISNNTFSYRTPPVAATVLALYLFITHPCIFYIFHQVVRKPFKFIKSGLETNDSLVNETNFLSFLSLFVYSFPAIAWQCVQAVSV